MKVHQTQMRRSWNMRKIRKRGKQHWSRISKKQNRKEKARRRRSNRRNSKANNKEKDKMNHPNKEKQNRNTNGANKTGKSIVTKTTKHTVKNRRRTVYPNKRNNRESDMCFNTSVILFYFINAVSFLSNRSLCFRKTIIHGPLINYRLYI
jgi:hypothetical protein